MSLTWFLVLLMSQAVQGQDVGESCLKGECDGFDTSDSISLLQKHASMLSKIAPIQANDVGVPAYLLCGVVWAVVLLTLFQLAVTNRRADDKTDESTPLAKDSNMVKAAEIKPEDQGIVYRWSLSGYLVEGPIPIAIWAPPAMIVGSIILAVWVLPVVIGGPFTFFTNKMACYFACYISFDALLRLIFGYSKYRMLLNLGFTHSEVMLMCGDEKVIPTRSLLDRSVWVYRMDSYSRKTLHILHWAGLAYIVGLCTDTTYQRFQFSVMGATSSILAQLCLWRSKAFLPNMWFWLSTVRTGDGYARRMNNIYCTTSSVCGMGMIVPLCSSFLSYAFHGDDPASAAAFLIIITFPCAWGDCLAEMVGVNGVLRFNVYGIGEINNKSVEGMVAMFLGSLLPCLPWAWAIGGWWPGLVIVGVLATIAETWSPRGFDNVFIPIFSAIGVLITCSMLGIIPHAPTMTHLLTH